MRVLTGILFIIAGISVIIGGIRESIIRNKVPLDINNVEINQIQAGEYVESSIGYIIDYCAAVSEEAKAYDTAPPPDEERYYIVPIFTEEEEYYVALEVPKDKFDLADKISDETWKYLNGEIQAIQEEPMSIKGSVENLNAEVEQYMVEWFIQAGYFETSEPSEIRKYIVPYQIEIFEEGINKIILSIGIGIGTIIAGVFMVIRGRRSNVSIGI